MKKGIICIIICMLMITISGLPVIASGENERRDPVKIKSGITSDERVNLTILVYSGFWSFIYSQILRKNGSVVVTGITVWGNQITGGVDYPNSLTDEHGVCTIQLHSGEEYIIGVSNYRGLVYVINYVVFTIRITSDTTMSVILHGILFPGLVISK